jgi:hypothetical protein
MGKKLTAKKARKILHDKSVHGNPLTEKQRKFFGAIAGGAKPYDEAQMGTMINPITSENVSNFLELFSIPQKALTQLFTGKYQAPSEAMNVKNPVGAFVVDAVLDPVNLVGAGLMGKTAKSAMAFKPKPGMMYRGLGEEGFKDATKSGVFRAKQNVVPEYYPGTKLQLNKSFGTNPYFTPKFETASGYGSKYIAEVPMSSANWRQRYVKSDWSQVADRPIPITEGRILQKDWLRGYKEVKPKKKEEGGWLDKYEEGGELKQKKNDNYGVQGNYNDYNISLPKGFKGWAYNTKGRNYSPAWGGQFQNGGNLMPAMAGANQTVPMAQLGDSIKPIPMQLAMGGSLPGAVGFTYARTINPAPANGPYAKKTKASAQNGMEMKYYQEGLDFKPKTISKNGGWLDKYQEGGDIPVDPEGYWNPENWGNPVIIPSTDITMQGVDQPLIGISDTGDVQYMEPGEDYEFDGEYVTEYPVAQAGKTIYVSDPRDPRLRAYQDSLNAYNSFIGLKNIAIDNTKKAPGAIEPGLAYSGREYKKMFDLYDEQNQKYSKIFKPIGNERLLLDPYYSTWGANKFKKPVERVVYRKPDPRKPEPRDPVFMPRERIEFEGGVPSTLTPRPLPQIQRDRGNFMLTFQEYDGMNAPANRTIYSNNRAELDRLMMELTKDPKKTGNWSTRGVYKDGGSINDADAQPIKKLDQLLNFTNYNKPTKGGWLDKYN